MTMETPPGKPGSALVHILVPHYPPAFLGGGPARTIEAMVRQSRRASAVYVFTSDTDHGARTPMNVPQNQWTLRDGTRVWYANTRKPWRLIMAFKQSSRAAPEFVYLNSLFNPLFSILPLLLRRIGFWGSSRFVLAPRGEVDPGALWLKSRKKLLYIKTARRLGLFRDLQWHASGPLEAQHLKCLGFDGKVLVKENETLLPLQAHASMGGTSDRTELLYVGRISPKKQVELLIEGLLATRGNFALHVVGESTDPDYERLLREKAAPLGTRVVWHGPADRNAIFEHFDRCDMTCLPTAGENFGHVVAESLSRSCPVMIMDVTPWTYRIRAGGGVIVPEATVEAWRDELQGLISATQGRTARRQGAAHAYKSWRRSVDPSSFLDYMLDGRFDELDTFGSAQ